MFRCLLAVLAGLLVLVLGACAGATDPATDITNVRARLNAHGYTNDGPATWWWEYDTVQAELGTANDTEVCGSGDGPKEPDHRCGPATGGSANAQIPLNVVISGLQPDTTYYFRACGQDTNDAAPTCANTRSFRTMRFDLEPVVEENLHAVAAHAARGGAAPAVPGLSCDAVCADWWLEEHRPIPNQVSSEELHRELRTLRSKARFLPRLRSLGTTLGLGELSFELGWKIGTGINQRFLRLGLPDIGDPGPQASNHKLWFWDFGEGQVTSGGASLPNNVWVFTYSAYNQTWTHIVTDSRVGPDCHYTPAPIGMLEAHGVLGQCIQGAETTSYYIPEDGLPALAAIQDYIGQPFDIETQTWTDYPTTSAEAETRVGTALELYKAPDAWYAWLLDPQTYEDPVAEDKQRPDDCEPTNSAFGGDPGLSRGTGNFVENQSQWWARYDTVPTSAFPAGSVVPTSGIPATGGQVYMRWGWTQPSPNPRIRWRGWGYRKIRAKHGWGPTAYAQTVAALQTTPVPAPRHPEYRVYTTPTTYPARSGGGKMCERVVVVQRDPIQSDRIPEQREGAPMNGIITSYGQYATGG